MSLNILSEMVDHERETLRAYEARVDNARRDVEQQEGRLRRAEALAFEGGTDRG